MRVQHVLAAMTVCGLAAGAAHAQPAPVAGQAPRPDIVLPVHAPTPKTQSFAGTEHLLGDMWGVRPFLARYGINLTLNYINESLGVASGGKRRGFDYSHQVTMGIDVDLGRAFDLTGTSFHMLGVQRAGRNLAKDYLSNTNIVEPQEDYGVGGNVLYHLVYMYLEHASADKRFDLIVGHLPANLKFGSSPLFCYAINNTLCAHPIAVSGGTHWRSWPFAEWGSVGTYRPIKQVYAEAGVFEDSPKDGGSSGFDLSFAHLGVIFPIEFGWEPSFGHSALVGHYKIGGYVDTSDNKEYYESINGAPIVLSHQAAAIESTRAAWYIGADQMVMRFGPHVNDGLILMGLVGVNEGRSLAERAEYIVGALAQGMIPKRPNDAISVFFTQIFMNPDVTRTQELELSLGEPLLNGVKVPETKIGTLEANYNIHLAHGLSFAPDFQYIIRPDAGSYYKNAVILGFKTVVQL